MQPFLAVFAVTGGVAIFQVSNAIIAIHLPLRLAHEGYGAVAVGLVTTAHAIGFMAGCLLGPRVIRSVGHIRAFAVFAAICSVAALAFGFGVLPVLWIVLRLIVGFATAGLFTVTESWLNDRTPAAYRGRVLSIYMIATKLTYAFGQALPSFTDTGSLAAFMVAGAFYTLSLIPVAMTHATSPEVPDPRRLGLRELYRIAPAAAVGCIAVGLVNSAVIGMTPLYGTRLGYGATTITAALIALQVGSLVVQWPLGMLSDRIDRRYFIAGCAAVVAVVSAALTATGPLPLWLVPILFGIWGAAGLSMYSLCIAHANDFAPPGRAVQVSSTLLFAWSLGSITGPLLATGAMEALGPRGLFVYAALLSAATGLFVAYRMTRRAAKPPSEREPHVGVPATSPALTALDPRSREKPGGQEAA